MDNNIVEIIVKQPEHAWAHWYWMLHPEYAIVWVTLICALMTLSALLFIGRLAGKDRQALLTQENDLRTNMRKGFKMLIVQAHSELEEMMHVDVNKANGSCWHGNMATIRTIQLSLNAMGLTELARANIAHQKIQAGKILYQIVEVEMAMRREFEMTQIPSAKVGRIQKAVEHLHQLETELSTVLSVI